MRIFIKGTANVTLELDVDPDETVLNVKQKICDQQSDLSPDRIRLIHAGKQLQDYATERPCRLPDFIVQNESTLHMVLQARPTRREALAQLPTNASASRAQKEWQSKAEKFDFDDDLHIIDPQSHFHLLRQLEREVVERSEYYREKRTYRTGIQGSAVIVNRPEIPVWLDQEIFRMIPIWKTLDHMQTTLEMFWHLMKSYTIISRVSESIERMKSQRFCTDTINILLQHEIDKVIEIRRVELVHIYSLKSCIETAAREVLENLDNDFFSIKISDVISLCHTLLEHVGSKESLAGNSGLQAALTLIRKTALLLDIAVVSYVRSHGSDFDTSYFGSEMEILVVSDGEDPFAFTCSWTRLACLDAFLDGRKVLVFQFFHKDPKNDRPRGAADVGSQILTRMQDLADIWGPVYAVPSSTGFIKFYGVSKGAICRVKKNSKCAIPRAVQCHYFSRASFFVRKTSKLLSGGEELLLAEDDMLLIGRGLRENHYCDYSISDFMKDYASDVVVLGTSESVWKTDTRSVAVGFSKYVGVTVSGSQKLIPQTTLKQHILDKWSTRPARSNPGILHQHLGVEISHCTGNARRTSLRELMTSTPIWSILERQFPDWTSTPWGRSLSAALHGNDREAIFQVWKEHAPWRTDIGELFCSMLELLDRTGQDDNDSFKAALLYNDDESAFSIAKEVNDWSIALKDTHLTGSYAVIIEQCPNCEVPDHSTSSCYSSRAYTVLETEFATEECTSQHNYKFYVMRPSGQHLRYVDSGSPHILILEPASGLSSLKIRHFGMPRTFMESCNRTDRSTRNMVYLRASSRSFHGKQKPKIKGKQSEHGSAHGAQPLDDAGSNFTHDQANTPASSNELTELSKQQKGSQSKMVYKYGRYSDHGVLSSKRFLQPLLH